MAAFGPRADPGAVPFSGGFRPSLDRPFDPDSAGNGSEPAPMGIADLGQVPTGGSDTYQTTSFQGTIVLTNLTTYNASLASESPDMSFQLNAYVGFSSGGSYFVYWVQDVLKVDTATEQVTVFDNIWNATSQPLPEIGPSAVHGNGSFGSFNVSGFPETYYGDTASCSKAGACTTLDYKGDGPATVLLQLNASLIGGKPSVRFSFNDGSGLQSFDTATFTPTVAPAAFEGFFVNASALSSACVRCAGDVELVAGGPDSGYQTALSGTTQLTLGIQRWNGHNYESIPDAYDYGIATAEGLSNASIRGAADPQGAPMAAVTNAPGSLGSLWGRGSVSTVGVTVVGGAGGTLGVGGVNEAFDGTYVEVTLVPGTYDLTVVSGATYALGNRTLTAGEYLTLEVGGAAVVFVPHGLGAEVWSVSLGGETLNGTGNITFGEPSGTYAFVVGSLSGFSSSPSSGNVTVNLSEANVSVTIDWSSTHVSLLAAIVAFLDLRVGPVAVYDILILFLVVGILAAIVSRRRPAKVRWRRPPSQPLPPPGEFNYGSLPPEPPHRPPPS